MYRLFSATLLSACIGANSQPMSLVRPFLGTWSCRSVNEAGSATRGSITYSTLSGTNTIAFVFDAPGYEVTGYIGYDGKLGRFFEVGSDSTGGSWTQLGSLLPSGMLSFVGHAMYGATSSRTRETEGMPDPAHLRDHTEMQQGDRWTDADDMTCTRAKRG